MKNEKGFTLIEMLIVLLIISVLILVTVPNVTKHFKTIDDKGCSAYIAMVQSQVEAYKIDHQKYPKLEDLIKGEYLPKVGESNESSTSKAECPNGDPIEITEDGEVRIDKTTKNESDSPST